MIYIELALKLKKTGFPFKNAWEVDDWIECGECGDGGPISDEIPVTLSELIEACGESLFSLTRHADIWQTNWIKDGIPGETAGRTPEEAVANLWLKLHE